MYVQLLQLEGRKDPTVVPDAAVQRSAAEPVNLYNPTVCYWRSVL